MPDLSADVNHPIGQDGIVRLLIELSADPNHAAHDGSTPLFSASQRGLDAVARALVEAGADPCVRSGGRLPEDVATGQLLARSLWGLRQQRRRAAEALLRPRFRVPQVRWDVVDFLFGQGPRAVARPGSARVIFK